MKKSLIALGIVSAFSTAAFAQSNVQVYGVVDAGVEVTSSGGVKRTALESGLNGGSHIGFKGSEDLGGGLKAEFLVESGFNVDTGEQAEAGVMFNRQSWVGLQSSVGSIRLGNQYSPMRATNIALDPFAKVGAGDSTRILGDGSLEERTANSVTYVSPDFSGFQTTVQYGFGESEKLSHNNYMGIGLNYKAGPILVSFAHGQQKYNFQAVGIDGDRKDTQIGGTYDLGVAKAYVSYLESKARNKITNDSDKSKGYLLGVAVPMGAHSFVASYTTSKLQNTDDSKSQQLALGYNYTLSKRTSAYASYAHVKNDTNADLGGATAAGDKVNRYQVGVRHTF